MRSFARALAVLAFCGLTACSTFDREWAQARSQPKRDPFSGAWEGRWRSTEHRGFTGRPAAGRLRCIFQADGRNRHRAHFHANWMIFSSRYVVNFVTERRGDELHFRGEHDLGAIFGGIYRYSGQATSSRLNATYDSRYDRGTFDLERVAAANAAPHYTRH